MNRSLSNWAIRKYVVLLLSGASLLTACSGDGTGNQPPVAVAHLSVTEVSVGHAVDVDAADSSDADHDTLTFAWTFSGPTGSQAKFDAPDASRTSFTPDFPGDYAITVNVSDGKGGKTAQTVNLHAVAGNARPTANIQVASTDVDTGVPITLKGEKSADPDPGDVITYSWSFTKTPGGSQAALSNASGIDPTTTLDLAGDYEIQLVVRDKAGAASDPVKVTLKAHNPNAGNHQPIATPEASAGTVKQGDTVGLDGTKSADPDSGDTLTYAWWLLDKPSGSAAKIADASAAKTSLVTDKAGKYVVTLVVTDSHGAKSQVGAVTIDATPVFVNHPPTAKASVDVAKVRPGKPVKLDGSASKDPDAGDTIAYAWRITSAPAASHAEIAADDAKKAVFHFAPDVAGDYALALAVTDTHGAKSEASVVFTASDDANVPPVARILAVPHSGEVGTSVGLDASTSVDADGDTLQYAWSVVTAPNGSAAAIATGNATTSFTPDVAGTYVVSVVVSDGHGGSSEAKVTFDAAPFDGRPTAVVRASATDVEPGTSVLLDATGSTDPENDTLQYMWSVVSQPAGAQVAFSGQAGAQPTFTAQLPGSYVIQLIVSDGHKWSDHVQITVNAAHSSP